MAAALALVSAGAYLVARLAGVVGDAQSDRLRQWWQGDEAEREALMTVQRERCPGAPFVLPTDGFIGLLYGDPRGPYSAAAPHQGIDIFSPGAAGVAPVYAAADGSAKAEFYLAGATLDTLLDADGTALVIHAQEDDHVSQPIGGAGARVSCGVLQLAQ